MSIAAAEPSTWHPLITYISFPNPDKAAFILQQQWRATMGWKYNYSSVITLLFEKVIRIHHRLEFQVVIGRIFEKHGFLSTALSLKSQMRLNDEFYASLLQLLGQWIEFRVGQACTKMGHWHLVSVNWIEVICTFVLFADPMANKLVAEEIVILPLCRWSAFLQT